MVKFINHSTGSAMWVHESRINEYIAAGHKLAASYSNGEKPTATEEKKPTVTRKKTTTK